jgi:hypothetical protein
MIKIEDVLKEFNYEIQYGSQFMWRCFGDNAWSVDFDHVSVTFDKKVGEVFMMEFDSHYGDPEVVYRWVAPEYEVAHYREAQERGYPVASSTQCYSYQSFLKMAKAANADLEPDFELMNDVELLLDAETLEIANKMAEERGITLDELVAEALRLQIEKLEAQKNKAA